jgi:hypothetical protein
MPMKKKVNNPGTGKRVKNNQNKKVNFNFHFVVVA